MLSFVQIQTKEKQLIQILQLKPSGPGLVN